MVSTNNRKESRRYYKDDLQTLPVLRDSTNRKSSRKNYYFRNSQYRNEAEFEAAQEEDEQRKWYNKRLMVFLNNLT